MHLHLHEHTHTHTNVLHWFAHFAGRTGRADDEDRYLNAATAAAPAADGDYLDEEDDEPLEFGPSDADDDTLDTFGACDDTEFRCANGQTVCIPIEQRCDETAQCADGSDETGCKRNTFEMGFFTTSTEMNRGASGDAHAKSSSERTYIFQHTSAHFCY